MRSTGLRARRRGCKSSIEQTTTYAGDGEHRKRPMVQTQTVPSSDDPLWQGIREAAAALAAEEPVLGSLMHASVLNQVRFEDALNYILAQRLGTEEAPAMLLRQVFDAVLAADPAIGTAARADLL